MLSNVTGDAIALFVYWLLNRFFPAPQAQVEEAVHDVKPSNNVGEDIDGEHEGQNGLGEKEVTEPTAEIMSAPVSRQASRK